MVSLLLTLVLLIVVYISYENRETKDQTKDEQNLPAIEVAKVDQGSIKELHYIGSDYETTYILSDGVWKQKDDLERPIDQANISSMLVTVANITANKVIAESLEDLASFGLDQPKPVLEAILTDGSKVILKIGDMAPSQEGYYALVNQDNKVYLLDSSYFTGINYTQLSMTSMETPPEIDPANINYIKVEQEEAQTIEIKLGATASMDISGFGSYPWYFIEPYGKGYTVDSAEIDKRLEGYASFRFVGCIDYKGEDLDKYGLDKPKTAITVGYYEREKSPTPTPSANGAKPVKRTSKKYKIYIGNQAEDGNYYVMVDGATAVYLFPSDKVDAMKNLDAYTLVNKYAALPNIENVDKITAVIDGNSYQMEINTITSEDADGKEVKKSTFQFNGKDAEDEAFRTMYRSLVSVMYDAPLKETDKVDLSNAKQILSLSFHLVKEDRILTVALYPYNDSFELIDIGTGVYFLADKRKIDLIIDAVTQFKTN